MTSEANQRLERPEKKEEFGRNVTVHAIFVRHGEKALSTEHAETSLTPNGADQAREFGQGLGDKVKGYASKTDRTIDTVRLAIESSDADKKLNFRIKDELGIAYNKDGEFSRAIHSQKKQILGEDFASLPVAEQHNRLLAYEAWSTNYYLSFRDKRPDPKSEAPVEVASKIASRVDLYIKTADRLRSGSEITLVNGTHDYCIAAFLKEVLTRATGNETHTGFDKIEDIGGPIDFTESFEVHINTDEKGEKHIGLSFRDQEYSINMERFRQLVEIGKQLK